MPFSARYCRASARRCAARRRRRRAPWIASSGTRDVGATLARSLRDLRNVGSGPRFITASAVYGDAAAPHAMPECVDDRANESADSARRAWPRARRRRTCRRRRSRCGDPARQRRDAADHLRDDRRLALAVRPCARSNQFQQRAGIRRVASARGIRTTQPVRIGECRDPRPCASSVRRLLAAVDQHEQRRAPPAARSRAARRAGSSRLRPASTARTRRQPRERERAAFDSGPAPARAGRAARRSALRRGQRLR